MKIAQSIGMLKSRLIYDFKPFIHYRMARFYSSFINVEDLCFDIGAHTGNRSEVWLTLGAKVVAVEPQPLFAKLINKKIAGNKNFRLLNEAIGDTQGTKKLHISYSNPAISTISESWMKTMKDFDSSVQFNDSVKIQVNTLDSLIGNFGIPQFCKIDVEGYEEEVLAGLSLPLPALSFEFFPTTPLRTMNCINRLELLGNYTYNWSFTETFRMNNVAWINAQEMQNLIAKYKGRKSGDIYAVLNR